MKKIAIIILAVVALSCFSSCSIYNNMVDAREGVRARFSTVDVQLQRRSDLIPNLVRTVQAYNVHERDLIESVVNARARLGGVTSDEERIAAENQMSGALSRLLVVVENYPDLKADANFRQLMDELSGTENRISVARRDYNEAVRTYNSMILRFPGNMIADRYGFTSAAYFEAAPAAYVVPVVSF